MAKRKIRLLNGAVASVKIVPQDNCVLTTIKFTTGFDQLTADAMEIKDTIYRDDGTRRAGIREWEPELTLFGATIEVAADQKDLFTENGSLMLTSVKLDATKLRRAKADESMKLSFNVILAGIPREVFDFIEILKKGTATIVIEQPKKQEEAEARLKAADYGLFKVPKEDGSEEGEGAEGAEPESEPEIEKPRGRRAQKA